MAEPRYKLAGGELCGAPFAVEPDGYGICERFGPHDRHAGVVRNPGSELFDVRTLEGLRRG